VTKSGDLITVQVAGPDTNLGGFGWMEDRYVFDTSKGFNMVDFKSTNAIQKKNWQVDYAKFKDVFLPIFIKYSSEYDDTAAGGVKLTFRAEATIKTKMLNEPVDQSEFALDKIGLRPGDTVVDKIQGDIRHEWKEKAGVVKQ
jgi:hypothetical protein